MKISVIIPLYNKVMAIGATLQSVLGQSTSAMEILVVDDGSTDGSAEVVQSLKDERIRLIRQPNRGVSAARNRGMREAKGDWILLLDGDDLLEPTALFTFARMAEQVPAANLLIGGYWDSQCADSSYSSISYTGSSVTRNPYRDIWRGIINPHIGNYLFRRELLSLAGGFDESISFYEDLDFLSRLLDRGVVAHTSFPIMTYRREYSQLSLCHRNITQEFAYHLSAERLQGGLYRELILAENLRLSLYGRLLMEDGEGAALYQRRYQSLFSLSCRLILWLKDQKRRFGRFLSRQSTRQPITCSKR